MKQSAANPFFPGQETSLGGSRASNKRRFLGVDAERIFHEGSAYPSFFFIRSHFLPSTFFKNNPHLKAKVVLQVRSLVLVNNKLKHNTAKRFGFRVF